MLVCVLVTLLITTANAFEKLMLYPHNPVELKLTSKVEPMVLATPSWVTFGDIPCQYFFNEGFYSLVDYRIVNDPVLFKSQA
jgi:hypothetical protein